MSNDATYRYKISDLIIEFKKDFLKMIDDAYSINKMYPYSHLIGANIGYPNAELGRFDPVCYVKLKGKELWLHHDNNGFFFDTIKKQDYYYRQPVVLWCKYNNNDEMILSIYYGDGLASINEMVSSGISNVSFIVYTQIGGITSFSRTGNVKEATRFILEKIPPSELMWFQLNTPQTQKKISASATSFKFS